MSTGIEMDNLAEPQAAGGKQKKSVSKKEKKARFHEYLTAFWYAWHQAWVQIRTHKGSYCLGFLACAVVVIITGILLSVIGNAPVVYLRISEMQSCEMDLRMKAMSPLEVQYVNYTQVAQTLKDTSPASDPDKFSYHSPRWEIQELLAYKCEGEVAKKNPGTTGWMHTGVGVNDSCIEEQNCFETYCKSKAVRSSGILFADYERESRMLLGRSWDYPAPKGLGKVYVSSAFARKLELSKGDNFTIDVSPLMSFRTLWNRIHRANKSIPASYNTRLDPRQYELLEGNWSNFQHIYVTLSVEDIYDDSTGKISVESSAEIVAEYNTLSRLFEMGIFEGDTAAKEFFHDVNMEEYAQLVAVNIPPPRVNIYLQNDMDDVRRDITKFSAEVIYRVGYLNLDVVPVVMEALDPFSYFSIFLGLIITLTVVVLMLLCIILIYSLLMINVESRQFELGVMRMVGSRRRGIVGLLTVQSLTYALPAIVIGLPVAQILGLGVFAVITEITDVNFPNTLTADSIVVAIVLGIAIPLVSAILPIRRALEMNVADAIDSTRSKTKAVTISINRAEQRKISWPMLVAGIFLVIFGLSVYLIFPLTLMTMNITMLLYLFFVLLILMLVACILIVLNFDNLIHRGLAQLFFFWERFSIRHILDANIIAHKLRNSKTTLMYSVSLGFVIFLSVSFDIQLSSIITMFEKGYGSNIGVGIQGINNNGQSYQLSSYQEVESYLESSPYVDKWAYATLPLTNVTKTYFSFSNIGRMTESHTDIYGVSPNFFEVTMSQYTEIGDRNINRSMPEDVDIGIQIYSLQGAKGMVLGTALKENLNIDTDTHFLLNEAFSEPDTSGTLSGMFSSFMSGSTGTGGLSIKAGDPPPIRKRPYIFLDVCPAFGFSSFTTVTDQPALVSFPQYISMSRGKVPDMDHLPIGLIFVKERSNITTKEVAKVIQDLEEITSRDGRGVYVWDLKTAIAAMDVAKKIINYFFYLTTIIAMVTSFFSLVSSMLANIMEQTKEIGVLRAIGITTPWIYRIYIYEAFVVVFGSAVIGILVGILMSYAIISNQTIFTKLPLVFVFPWQITLIILGLSVLFAFLASFSPLSNVLRHNISNIMRMF